METRVTPLRMDREDEKKMLPCRFFANGYCHKGNRCRFYHPLNTALNSIIRVPPLPPHFGGPPQQDGGRQSQQQSQQQQQQPPRQPQRIPPLFPSTPPMMNGGQRGMPPSLNGMMNGPPSNMHNYNNNYCPSPPSPQPFMDFDPPAPPPQSSPYMFDAPSVASPPQNTVFSHIDWSEFLAPGQAPPPPTQVPDERQERLRLASSLMNSDLPSSSSSNEDMPPEGRTQRKLTAKEELQMKVKEIAKELAEEPITPIHSLDSFFRNFTFNGYSSGGSKLKSHGLMDDTIGDKSRASGDSTEIGGSGLQNSTERLTVRDMADALMEIYIASEREREGERDKPTSP